MAPFNAVGKAPGVYIEEVQVPGPIAGVGTSTAAFVGPAEKGPLFTPVFLTNPTQFKDTFGSFIVAPTVYVTYAVDGFFRNGGSSLYFVRVGNAARAFLDLDDRATTPQATIRVTAKNEGAPGDNITVAVQDATGVTVKAVRVQTNVTSTVNNEATVADASGFRVGDEVHLEKGSDNERATVVSVDNTAKKLRFAANLTKPYAGGTVRIADLQAGQTSFRVDSTTGIEAGSYVQISNGTAESRVVSTVERTNGFLTLGQGLANPHPMDAAADPVEVATLEFNLVVTPQSGAPEVFSGLAMDPRHSRYFTKVVDSEHVDITPADPPNPTPPPDNRPVVLAATNLAGGTDENLSGLTGSAFTPLFTKGIDALQKVDNVNLLCVPDRTDQDVQAAMIAHCEKMQDRFAILDPQRNASIAEIKTQRGPLLSDRGYGALYYPWIEISNPNPEASGRIKVPPSGHLAGVFARSDDERGVHKAPANEIIRGALALERTLTDDEQGPLNEEGINVLRFFPGRGIRVWGARTLAPKDNTQWRYVNVRRLLLFVEESIQEGTQFAVFEPNNLTLWMTLKRQVDDFLTRVWRDGALFGATPKDAFRVRIDEELNPPSIRALGQVIVEVVLFPTTPAEFIVFRIIQQPGGPLLEE